MKVQHLHSPRDKKIFMELTREIRNSLTVDRSAFRLTVLAKLLIYLSITILSFVVILNTQNPVVYVFSFVLFGLGGVLLGFNFAHDLSHETVFKRSGPNRFFYGVIYTMLGAHAEAWRYRHVHSHHFAPNVEDYDTDLQITELIRVTPGSKRKWFHRFQHIYAPVAYMFYSLYWVFIKDFVIYFQSESRSPMYRVSFWMQKFLYVGYILAVPLLFSKVSVATVLIGFFAMHFVQSIFLLFTFFMTHHVEGLEYPDTDENGNITVSWMMNQIISSNDFHPFSKAANFIFGGFNNHIAHHLFPRMHHFHYPEVSRIIYNVLEKYGVYPNKTSYFGGALSHLRYLRRMGR